MKLSLGTAQFGTNYGVANHQGQISWQEAKNILKIAQSGGVKTLDTAVSYGSAEEVLGEVGIHDFDCVSKLPLLPKNVGDIKAWVNTQVIESINRLDISHLSGMLLHHPDDILGPKGNEYLIALLDAKDQGYIENIGFSIYSPEILDKVTRVFWPDVVQVPYNVFDQRISTSGWLDRLVGRGTKIHARSVFLQGLLLMQSDKRPKYFDKWDKDLAIWDDLVATQNISPMEYALNYVIADSRIDKVIVGVDNGGQLSELISACELEVGCGLKSMTIDDLGLIDPFRWSLQ
jgi:aryl-alcohol dehydrogenase-like predicted oxidoreductase